MDFAHLKSCSARYGEKNDCTVKAFAVVTGMSYEEAHEEMRKKGRPNRKGLRADHPDYNKRMIDALHQNGFKTQRVFPKSRTVRTLGRNIKHSGTFLVFVRGHVLAIKNRKVIDWTDGRCHRIKSVFLVTR